MFVKKPIGVGLTVALVAMIVTAMTAAAALGADADDHLLNKNGGGALRSIATAPINQPDAGEFVNVGAVNLVTGAGTITCEEIEFGTTVKDNTVGEPVLAIPFGVAEQADGAAGDTGCRTGTPAVAVPTYFDTNNQGAVGAGANTVATINLTDNNTGTITGTVHNLAFSLNVPGVGFCKGNVDTKTGTVTNAASEPFGEEGAAPNISIKFETKIPVTAPGEGSECKGLAGTEPELKGTFRLETPSTSTEGWWFNT